MRLSSQKTVAVIQARLGSQRLPGKVLLPIGHQPMLDWVVQRAARASTLDQIVVATSDRKQDDRLAEYCHRQGWMVVRGSEQDVLSRFCLAAERTDADRLVRITADCPLVDPRLVDAVVHALDEEEGVDYACNFFPHRWFPRGLDVEVLTRATLEIVAAKATDAAEREHVTLHIYRNPDRFRIRGVAPEKDFSEHRWTVDTPEDRELIQAIANHFGQDRFGWRDVLELTAGRADWQKWNAHVKQKAA